MDALGSIAGAVLGGPIGSVVGSIASDVVGSVAKGLTGGSGAGDIFGAVLGPLKNAFGSLFGAANPLKQLGASPFPLPFSPAGMPSDMFNPGNLFNSLNSIVNNIGGTQGLDGMMADAQSKLLSDKPSDQIAGMQEFMKAQQMMQTIITVTQTKGKLAMEAIKSAAIS
jgi:hypothetical protein